MKTWLNESEGKQKLRIIESTDTEKEWARKWYQQEVANGNTSLGRLVLDRTDVTPDLEELFDLQFVQEEV